MFARRPILLLACGVMLAAIPGQMNSAEAVPLKFNQIDLTDGRQLKNVVVKSYDARTERLLIVADKTALTIPIALLPPPFNEKLKAAPAAGGSVSTALSLPRPPVASTPAPAEAEATAVAVPTTPAPEVNVPGETPAPVPQPAPRTNPRPRRGSDSGEPAAASPTQHQFVARSRANRYYRYEHQVGSNSISITSLEFDLGTTQPVPGWPGRCRTEGKAFIEYFDSKGRSYQRTTSTFEILTEQKPGEEIKVVDFTRKS
jgi:hypothetical protein